MFYKALFSLFLVLGFWSASLSVEAAPEDVARANALYGEFQSAQQFFVNAQTGFEAAIASGDLVAASSFFTQIDRQQAVMSSSLNSVRAIFNSGDLVDGEGAEVNALRNLMVPAERDSRAARDVADQTLRDAGVVPLPQLNAEEGSAALDEINDRSGVLEQQHDALQVQLEAALEDGDIDGAREFYRQMLLATESILLLKDEYEALDARVLDQTVSEAIQGAINGLIVGLGPRALALEADNNDARAAIDAAAAETDPDPDLDNPPTDPENPDITPSDPDGDGVSENGLMSRDGGLVPCGDRDDTGKNERCSACHFLVLLYNIVKFITNLLVIVAVVVIAIAGVIYVVSAGNSGMTSRAKDAIKYALVGVLVVISAWVVITYIMNQVASEDVLSNQSANGFNLYKTGSPWKFTCQWDARLEE